MSAVVDARDRISASPSETPFFAKTSYRLICEMARPTTVSVTSSTFASWPSMTDVTVGFGAALDSGAAATMSAHAAAPAANVVRTIRFMRHL